MGGEKKKEKLCSISNIWIPLHTLECLIDQLIVLYVGSFGLLISFQSFKDAVVNLHIHTEH